MSSHPPSAPRLVGDPIAARVLCGRTPRRRQRLPEHPRGAAHGRARRRCTTAAPTAVPLLLFVQPAGRMARNRGCSFCSLRKRRPTPRRVHALRVPARRVRRLPPRKAAVGGGEPLRLRSAAALRAGGEKHAEQRRAEVVDRLDVRRCVVGDFLPPPRPTASASPKSRTLTRRSPPHPRASPARAFTSCVEADRCDAGNVGERPITAGCARAGQKLHPSFAGARLCIGTSTPARRRQGPEAAFARSAVAKRAIGSTPHRVCWWCPFGGVR